MATDFFTLEAVPARYGDCLLLHYGNTDDPGLILIDGGPTQVWKPFLEKRLKAIQAKRGANFLIDLLMVSHIDDDHVLGILDFTKAWKETKAAGNKWPYPVREFWHNSFERISNAETMGAVTASVTASANASSLDEIDVDEIRVPEDEEGESETLVPIAEVDKPDARAGLKVLSSVPNGKKLRDDVMALGVAKNIGFDGLVRPGVAGRVPVKMGPDLSLHVAAPLAKQLEALQKMFAKKLPKGPDATLAAYTDTSVPNLSSIAVLARFKDKTMLLTGDARGDYLIEGLKGEGLLAEGATLHVDILKMPHHGSDRNVDPSFFSTITADHYVASADGTFGNPDRPTMEMLIEQRGKDAEFTIHLTYPLAEIDARRRGEWDKDRQGEIDDGKPKVRREWNPATDDLAALFEAKRKDGYKFTVSAPATAGESARVELLATAPY
jgi:hypothetical protein